MGRSFAQLAFTPGVKQQQQKHGSRHLYARLEQSEKPSQPSQSSQSGHASEAGDLFGPDEREFIATRDGFYMASVSETGWPYVQYRGGAKGFLRVLDERTLGFADLRGNKQYISTGNLEHDNRVALFLMDYPTQSRLKILGRAEIHEGDAIAQKLIEKLRMPEEKTLVERAMLIHVEGFDWNCQQHITPRYTQGELTEYLAPMRRRIEALERDNERLRKLQK